MNKRKQRNGRLDKRLSKPIERFTDADKFNIAMEVATGKKDPKDILAKQPKASTYWNLTAKMADGAARRRKARGALHGDPFRRASRRRRRDHFRARLPAQA
jgi:hypothetical protein